MHKTGGGEGWADVWMKGKFAWEYKRKRRSLLEAYQQLLRYREDLENPPLLVVCDLNRFEVHTNFTGTAKRVYDFDLTGVNADIKKAMELGNSLGMRQTKDYNVKGSAWIAKDDGRMVKFSFDNIFTFGDGKIDSTHFEGTITKQ